MLICCDNEGCIVEAKGAGFDLAALDALAATIASSGFEFAICTGRSVPYVEAMVQVLGLLDSRIPCVCEAGAVLYIPRSDTYELLAEPVDPTIFRQILPAGSYREEPGKLVGYSIYPAPGHTVSELFQLVTGLNRTDVQVTRSIAAVDITPLGVDKATGIQHLMSRAGIDSGDVLAIGDSWNDLPMLRTAARAACPANAVAEVKAVADYISPLSHTAGVRDVISWAKALETSQAR